MDDVGLFKRQAWDGSATAGPIQASGRHAFGGITGPTPSQFCAFIDSNIIMRVLALVVHCRSGVKPPEPAVFCIALKVFIAC
jgi:hypothetical protein